VTPCNYQITNISLQPATFCQPEDGGSRLPNKLITISHTTGSHIIEDIIFIVTIMISSDAIDSSYIQDEVMSVSDSRNQFIMFQLSMF
jgi:hypothetical protein